MSWEMWPVCPTDCHSRGTYYRSLPYYGIRHHRTAGKASPKYRRGGRRGRFGCRPRGLPIVFRGQATAGRIPVRMSADTPSREPQFLVHKDGDHVAVTVQDVEPGIAHGFVLESDRSVTVEVKDSVPLGHKIALTDLAEGD